MDTKVLLTGIISFIAGALLVSVAASSFDKPTNNQSMNKEQSMVESLRGKMGDEFDKAFLSGMIMHHQDAVDMAKMAESQANHTEVKELAKKITETQRQEINDMKQWQVGWGFTTDTMKMNH
jgi:uncharacterized protein (DUF305 family)